MLHWSRGRVVHLLEIRIIASDSDRVYEHNDVKSPPRARAKDVIQIQERRFHEWSLKGLFGKMHYITNLIEEIGRVRYEGESTGMALVGLVMYRLFIVLLKPDG